MATCRRQLRCRYDGLQHTGTVTSAGKDVASSPRNLRPSSSVNAAVQRGVQSGMLPGKLAYTGATKRTSQAFSVKSSGVMRPMGWLA